jgi:Pyruvate/2-oxoacid:ferredoxin oxidoreductase gamma subunit
MSQANKERLETVKEQGKTALTSAITAVCIGLFFQFGLIGPKAEEAKTRLEQRITRIETRIDAMDSAALQAAAENRRQWESQEKFFNERFRSIDKQFEDIKYQLRGNSQGAH